MVLAVRVVGAGPNGSQFDELTHTLDIAMDGARLGGMERINVHPGDIIELRRRNGRARFRVMWVGEKGTPRTGHVGVQAIDVLPDFWGLEVPVQGEAPIAPIHSHQAHERQAS
ncbi:MAG TPA: hypothetical protein VMU28_07925 [Terriglobales bacterium]|nr:hypothetical protein [Terriglobales bacterium]